MATNRKRLLGCACLGLVVTALVSFFSVILGVFIGISVFGSQGALRGKVLYGKGPNKIAVVYLSGVILEGAPEFSPFSPISGLAGSEEFKGLLREVAKDKAVKALVIRINSPGGSVTAAEEIYQAIKELKLTGRVVVASMGDTAASGAYFVSSIADKIVAGPATLTGNIGVVAEVINVKGLYEKLGLKSEVYKSGEFKDILNPARERTEEEKVMLQEVLDTTYDLFVDRVSNGRGMAGEAVRQLAEGRIYSGKKAKELGLVDEIGGFGDAVETAKNLAGITEAQVVEYRREGLLDVLLGGIYKLTPQSFLTSLFKPFGVSVKYLFVY